jgi:hypothetical protein
MVERTDQSIFGLFIHRHVSPRGCGERRVLRFDGVFDSLDAKYWSAS